MLYNNRLRNYLCVVTACVFILFSCDEKQGRTSLLQAEGALGQHPDTTANANLYTAKSFLAQGNNEEAMKHLLIAKDYAEYSNNTSLLGVIYHDIGNAYSGGGSFRKALESFKKAQSYYSQSGNKKREALVQDHIGNMVFVLGEPDSALVYFQRVLNYAEETGDEWYVARSHRRISCAYWDLEQYDKAKEHALLSVSLDKERDDEVFNYPTLTKCYLQEEKLDSALHYTEKLKEVKYADTKETLLTYHHLKSLIFEKKGDYIAALKESKAVVQLQSSLAEDIRNSSIPYLQEQYDKERIEAEYNQVIIHRLRLIIVVISIILFGALSGWFLMYRIKRKENELLEAERALSTFREMLTQQEEQIQNYDRKLIQQHEDYKQVVLERDEKSEYLRSFLMDKLDIAQKIAQLNIVPNDNNSAFMKRYQKVFGKNLMDELGWDNLYALINQLYDGFVDKIKELYPDLSDKDLQMCCFIRVGFRPEEMAVLLNYTQNTVRVKKTRLWQKLKFKDYETFLSTIMAV
ncbi:hypothetical protein [Bacteroides sp. 519]|uniref:hypothetical protein n=1 Tax=Bacteroides sp. 519 TaxID=2302937 RepID=UPI0013CF72CA|nr:hypothetical protein [Bacteroides sp. 519]NDV58781.1 hypothetical protein [Bacteroides sp. 519]